MNFDLQYGRWYEAQISLSQFERQIVDSERLRVELCRYQLFGAVEPTEQGYVVRAQFRGVSGVYSLPEQCVSIEEVANI